MAELLKDLYSKEFIEKLGEKLFMVYPNFQKKEFIENVFCPTWQELELKPRMRHISTIFHKHLPFSYKPQLDILIKVK